MRVCLVSEQYPPESARGGIATQTWNKAQTLARLGHTVHVLSCGGRRDADLRTETDGKVVVHRMPPPGNGVSLYEPAVYAVGYAWSVLRYLDRLTGTTQFDVINFPEWGAEGFAYQLNRTRWNWVPVVVHLHAPLAMLAEHMGWPAKDSQLYRVGRFMEEVSISLADGLMASSANIADFAASYYRVPRESIDVVYTGIDIETFRPCGEQDRDPDGPTVLFVGNIALNKGARTVLEAVLRLRARDPRIRLQMVGPTDGDLRESLKRQAIREGAGGRVEFVEFVDRSRLADYYRRADVFCSPSTYEAGVANVWIEAMACGCPVVASTAGGAPEAVIDGETGFLVPPRDVEATAAALDRILGDPALRRRLAAGARRRAEDYFALDRYIGRVLAAYEKAIERSREKLALLKAEAD